MRRVRPLIIAFAFACGGDSSTQPNAAASVVGTWRLQSVNASALPFVLTQTGAGTLEVISDVVTVEATGYYTEITTLRSTIAGQVTTQSIPDAGTYTLDGIAVSFRSSTDGSTATGSISGNTFFLAVDGMAFIYKRE